MKTKTWNIFNTKDYGFVFLIILSHIITCTGYEAFFPLSAVKMTLPKTKKSIQQLDRIPIAKFHVNTLNNQKNSSDYIYKIENDSHDFLQINRKTGEIFIGDNFQNLENSTTFIISAYNMKTKSDDAHMSIEITTTLNTDFCKEYEKLCFWDSATYTIDEDKKLEKQQQLQQITPYRKIGDLSSSSYKRLCPQYDIVYHLKNSTSFSSSTSAEGYVSVERDGSLYVNEYLDHDSLNPGFQIKLNIECLIRTSPDVQPKSFLKQILLSILDRNDNGPKLQENNTKWYFYLNDPHFLKDDKIDQKIIFLDQDSLAMNSHLKYEIHNDTFEIFKPICNAYETDHMGSKNTVISCMLVFARDGILRKSPYCVTLEANDRSVDSNDMKSATASICIEVDLEKIHESDRPTALALHSPSTGSHSKRGRNGRDQKQSRRLIQTSEEDLTSKSNGVKSLKPIQIVYPRDVYVYRTASNLSRVTQPEQMNELISRSSIKFNLLDDPTKAFAITELAGIIYINNVTALKMAPETIYYLSVSWQKGHQNVIIHLEKGRPNNETCEELDEAPPSYSCSQVGTKRECNKICGAGTDGGVCQWRGSNNTGLTVYYSTCSPNLTYCPDNICDPLEEIGQRSDVFICPQDCSPSTKLFGPHTTNDNKRGIYAASGICTCDHFGKCSCAVHDTFPAKLKKSIKNKNGNDKKLTQNSTSPSVPSDLYLTANGYSASFECGTPCIILMVGCSSALIMIVIVLIVSGRSYVKRLKRKVITEKNENDRNNQNDHDLPLVPLESEFKFETNIDSKWEFPRENLTLDITLGEGEFGKVVKAYARNISDVPGITIVAVKMLKSNVNLGNSVERQALLSEFKSLQEVSHPNVIKLLGACTRGELPMIIIEFAKYGSLRSYLRLSRKIECSGIEFTNGVEPITAKDILSFAWQICKGMAYLSEIKLVHRDLAARNVLLADRKICKISDFGLTRDIYEDDAYLKRSRDRVPVKWMAPESLADHVYTTKSDVWAFGVLAWELITLGASPYPGIPPENLYHLLKTGYRMERPENCSEEIYSIIRKCWASSPSSRPSFKYLASQWENLLGNNAKYLDLEEANAVSNPMYCQDEKISATTNEQQQSESVPVINPNHHEFGEPEGLEHLWKSPLIYSENNIEQQFDNNIEILEENDHEINNADHAEVRERFKIPPGYDLPRALIETKTIEQSLRYQNDIRFPLNITIQSPSSPKSTGGLIKSNNNRQNRPQSIKLDPNHYSIPVKRGRSYMDMTNKNIISDNLDNEDIEKKLSKNITFRFSSLLNINEQTSVV